MANTTPNTVVWARFITSAAVKMIDGSTREFSWPEGRNGNVPVCNGGALSVETWETASSSFLEAIIIAPGVWHSVSVKSELRKIEVLLPQQPGAAN